MLVEVCSGAARGPESSGSSAASVLNLRLRPGLQVAAVLKQPAAGAEAGQGEPTAVLLLSQKWDRLH